MGGQKPHRRRCTKRSRQHPNRRKKSRRSFYRGCPPTKRRCRRKGRTSLRKFKFNSSVCLPIFPPIPPSKPPEPLKDELVKDEICGIIQQDCNGQFVEYWRSMGISPFHGSVIVFNSSECVMTVKADVDGECLTLFTIEEKDQTKSVTLRSITNLEISCEGSSGAMCSGKFCLTLYYQR
ncbi:DUF3992 domain-containing protein [Brevibacillus laterosporus]|uniref:DUF3992 domain-containing protein n=1 Tax=Brevibacillus laterosporus TaxID=1465 RepID=UPI003D190C0B